MYFIELLVKKFLKREKQEGYNPLADTNSDSEYENCEHIFMPIDSTGEILACTLCGLVVHRKDFKKKTVFNE